MQDPREPEGRAARRPRVPAWLTADHWRGYAWHDLLPARGRTRRFEPGPLGLLGMMLATLAATLLLIHHGTSVLDGSDSEADAVPGTVPGPPEGELRIMPVGDALTQGSSGDHTWRYHLWSHLDETGVDFSFVGPHDDVYSLEEGEHGDHSYAEPDFDTDHAARWGQSTAEMADGIARVAAEHEPHYLLIMAGAEDLLDGASPESALEEIGATVSTARVALEGARFVVGELPRAEGTDGSAGGDLDQRIDRFNMGLVDLAEQLTSENSPVVVARVAEDYAPDHDNWEGVHPNTRGETKIAAAFADALADPLEVGEPFPRPLPETVTGPRTRPEPEAEEVEDGLRISWEQVPGATDYRVEQRRTAPDPDEAAVLPVEVERDGEHRSVLVDSLFSGADYEFVVYPYKGRDEGAGSEALELVYDDDPPPAPEGLSVRGDGTVAWDEVEEASHYEVWARPLRCTVSDDSRRPLPGTDPPEHATGADEPGDGDGGSGPPPSDPPQPPPPGTDGPTDPAEPTDPGGSDGPQNPPAPTDPTGPPDAGGADTCQPRDGLGPDQGQGWTSQGPSGSEPLWGPTVDGPHEVVVRSYRDYVPGAYSDPVLLGG